jgi:hypothetical protein
MKTHLKAPGTKRLKLKYDKLLSNVAFRFNLRRYITESVTTVNADAARLTAQLQVSTATEQRLLAELAQVGGAG